MAKLTNCQGCGADTRRQDELCGPCSLPGVTRLNDQVGRKLVGENGSFDPGPSIDDLDDCRGSRRNPLAEGSLRESLQGSAELEHEIDLAEAEAEVAADTPQSPNSKEADEWNEQMEWHKELYELGEVVNSPEMPIVGDYDEEIGVDQTIRSIVRAEDPLDIPDRELVAAAKEPGVYEENRNPGHNGGKGTGIGGNRYRAGRKRA